MRMREYSEALPKPMVPIGYRPILWHVMRYYAHFGHKDFILCLGYKADIIKSYFLEYNECVSNDFVLSNGGKNLEMLSTDIHDWNITFVDTGLMSNVGQRLRSVQKHLQGEEMFLANYTDAVSDVPLPAVIDSFQKSGNIACFVSVKPRASFHMIETETGGLVKSIEHIGKSGARMNGGFMVLRQEIFSYLRDGEELVEQPFRRLIDDRMLMAYPHEGFWACMDTFKEKQDLDDVFSRGDAPWAVWNSPTKELNPRDSSAVLAAGSRKELM